MDYPISRLPLQRRAVGRPHPARRGIFSIQRLIMLADLRLETGFVDIFEYASQGGHTGQARLGGLQDGQQGSGMGLDPVGNGAVFPAYSPVPR